MGKLLRQVFQRRLGRMLLSFREPPAVQCQNPV